MIKRELHKFGGSSLADAQCYQRVASIIAQCSNQNDLIVVSAAGSTTDQLIDWARLSTSNAQKALQVQKKLYFFHKQLISKTLKLQNALRLFTIFESEFDQINLLLQQKKLNKNCFAEIIGHGEIWSARLLAALLNQQSISSIWLDARDFLRAEGSMQPKITVESSHKLLSKILNQHPRKRIVITGFICRDHAQKTVLLGRNGSDYSATQIGALAGTQRVTIWSNVAGIYTADPKIVKQACLIKQLRFDEANELARLNGTVLHARTLQPLSQNTLELRFCSSYTPDHESTSIERVLISGTGAKIVTHRDNIYLIELELPNYSNLFEQQQQISHALQKAGLPFLTEYAHYESSLLQWSYHQEIIKDAFALVKSITSLGKLRLRSGLSIVAIIGTAISQHPSHSEKFYQILQNYLLKHIWQAKDSKSIVAVLQHKSARSLVADLHLSLFDTRKKIGIVLCGKQDIGLSWLKLFAQQKRKISQHYKCELALVGVINNDHAWLDYKGIEVHQALAFFSNEAIQYDAAAISNWLNHHPFDHLIFLDTTSNALLAKRYQYFVKKGWHIITANPMIGALGNYEYRKIKRTLSKTGSYWLANAAVTSGLPVCHTLHTMRDLGDTLLAIYGCFPGITSWLLQNYDKNILFTELLKTARQQGRTQLDPRIDLSEKFILYQLVLLAREAGYLIDASQIQVESIIPRTCINMSLDEFLRYDNPINQKWQNRIEAAQVIGLSLRHIVRFDTHGQKKMGIEAIDPQHPLASGLPGEQVIMIKSLWYQNPPLVIRGPMNSYNATAGTLQSDLYHLIRLLH